VKSHELAKKLLECPDFELQFSGMLISFEYGHKYARFDQLEIADIGHSDKVIIITGDEV
jgi:hypothetical protein